MFKRHHQVQGQPGLREKAHAFDPLKNIKNKLIKTKVSVYSEASWRQVKRGLCAGTGSEGSEGRGLWGTWIPGVTPECSVGGQRRGSFCCLLPTPFRIPGAASYLLTLSP